MSSSIPCRIVGYGLSEALPSIFPRPILSKRAPNSSDKKEIGQEWVYVSANQVWILTSIVNNLAVWTNIAGGAGVFTSLIVNPGPTLLFGDVTMTPGAAHTISIGEDATDHTIGIGSTTGVSAVTIRAGTAGVQVTTAVTGTISLGNNAMTGTITVGRST